MTIQPKYRISLLVAGLSLCLALPSHSAAQDTNSSANPAAATSQPQAQSFTATGCLSKDADGNIRLHVSSPDSKGSGTSAAEATYALSTTKTDLDLSAHLGHTVTITGNLVIPDMASANPAASQVKQVDVTDLKMVTDSCSSNHR
jgi:hypothetical protein